LSISFNQPMKKFFIYSLNIYDDDAVGRHCILLSKLAARLGWDVELFAIGHSPDILDVSEIEKYAVSEAVLFFSYSIYDKNLDYLLGLNFKYKICYFHGVTPPQLLAAFEPECSNQCQMAYMQFKKLAFFDLVLSNSSSSSKFLSAFTNKDTKYIPPLTYDSHFLDSTLKKFHFDRKKITFTFLGRVSSHKQVEDGLVLLEKLLKKGFLATYNIVGSYGNNCYFEELKKIIAAKSLSTYVNFFGYVNDELKKDIMIKSDYLFVPSYHEGFCIPIFESMYLGTPVIYRKGVPPNEVVGLAGIPFTSIDKLSDKIDKIHNKKNLAILSKKSYSQSLIIKKAFSDDCYIDTIFNKIEII